MNFIFEYKKALYRGDMVEVPVPVVKFEMEYNGIVEGHHILVDTGSNGTHINTKGLAIVGSKYEIAVDITHIKLKLFLPYTDELVNFYVNRLSDLTAKEDYPNPVGLIGCNILKDYLLIIDYRSKEIWFEKAGSIKDDLYKIEAEFTENYFIFFQVNYSGKKLKLIFDTGCGDDLILFEHRVNLIYTTLETNDSRGANGASYQIDTAENEIQITDTYKTKIKIFKNHEVTKDFDFDGILGNNIFFDNKIYIDYPNKSFYTEQPCVLMDAKNHK